MSTYEYVWIQDFSKNRFLTRKTWEFWKNKITFTYIGRSKANFKNTNLILPTFGKNLGEELSKYDVYISASRYDPGPNHIIESLACEIPTYALDISGGAVEMVGKNHVYSSFEDLCTILKNKKFDKNKGLKPVNWEKCIDLYYQKILELF